MLLLALAIAAQGQTLKDKLDRLVEYDLPEASETGIVVYDLTAKRPLYHYRANKLCRPASTMKLLTAITALAQPDADKPFTTEVWHDGYIAGDTLVGHIYVVGGFDPEFADESMEALIDQVNAFPFTVLKGAIYGDVSMKDSLYWGSGWAWDDNPAGYQPYLSPLIYHKGKVVVTATPSAVKGEKAIVACRPASDFYSISNQTATQTPAAGKFEVTRNWLELKNDIVVRGNVEGKREGEVNMAPSQDFFMHTFVQRLRQRGIACAPVYDYAEFTADSTAVRMALVECPVQKVVNEMMKESDNLSAEALLCKLAVAYKGHRKVSADDGIDAIKEMIERVGHNPADFRIADGCGLSNYNYVTPELLVAFLRYAYTDTRVFRTLYKALPVSGIDGTLKYRMGKGSVAFRKVNAKTGTFTGICTLAGYLKTKSGHDVAFAIMNQNAMSPAKARVFQNKVCELLCAE